MDERLDRAAHVKAVVPERCWGADAKSLNTFLFAVFNRLELEQHFRLPFEELL